MTSFLPFPDWVPWWVHLAVMIALLLFALLFLLMPFSVFGVKARLEAMEARLDEIQGEIRSLSLRLPEPSLPELDDYADPAPSIRRPGLRPPIPPAPLSPGTARDRPSPPPPSPPPSRTEPRLY